MSEPTAPALTVAEIAMEIAFPPAFLETVRARYGMRPTRDAAMSTSVGGIGPLLRDRIVAQAEAGLRTIGITFLYETTWIQSWFEWGQMHLEKRSVAPYLRELLKDSGIQLKVPMFDGTTAEVQVWQLDFGKARVYFLDSPPITHVVYPSEEDAPHRTPNPVAWGDDLRLKQSWLIGRGGLLLLKQLNIAPDIVVLSETPTLFGHPRLAKDELQNEPLFERTRFIFNDHTPMEYAHPVWSKDVQNRLKLDTSTYVPVPGAPKSREEVDVTRLLIGLCDGVFGVAEKHGRVMRAMPSLKDYGDKIESVTNGVSVDFWQSSDYRAAANLTDDQLLKLLDKKKAELLDWVWRTYGLWHTWKDQVRGKGVVIWTRRITGYKRLDLLHGICRDPGLKKQFLDANIVMLIGGRIHQHDDQAQTLIYNLLDLLSQDQVLQERIVLVDNFNVWSAPRIFQGCDAAVMLADDGREASATGFMKAQLNGDLVIATNDGAVPESVIFQGQENPGQVANGFEVPYVQGHPTAEGLVKALKALNQILKNPAQHAAMKRAAFAAQSQVSIERTVKDTLELYQRTMAKSALVSTPSPT
jgi:starch phosphorylase